MTGEVRLGELRGEVRCGVRCGEVRHVRGPYWILLRWAGNQRQRQSAEEHCICNPAWPHSCVVALTVKTGQIFLISNSELSFFVCEADLYILMLYVRMYVN